MSRAVDQRRTGRHGARRTAGPIPGAAIPVAGIFLAALALAAAPASAANLQARGDVTLAQEELNDSSSEYLRQTWALDWRRQFSLPISYRLSLRVQDDRGETEIAGTRFDLRTRTLMPSASLTYRLPEFGLSASGQLNDEQRIDPATGLEVSRRIERSTLSLLLHPFEHGDGTLSADRLAFSGGALRTTDDRFSLTFRYTSPQLRIANENRVQHFTDDRSGLSRIGIGPRLTAAWARSFGERLQLSTQYVLDYFRTEQTARGTATVSDAIELEPVAGLHGVDDLPDVTDPLTPEPRLVDRDFEAGAGIQLGPTGASFNNLALDMGRFVAADELRVHVRSSSGAFVPFADVVSWSVYSSEDGLRWAPVVTATPEFDATMSAWKIPFETTTARHFKVVNFGVNTLDTVVTELQGFVHETFQPDQTRVSSSIRQGLALAATVRLTPTIQVGYTGQFNANATTPYSGETIWAGDVSNSLVTRLGPHGPLNYALLLNQTWTGQASGAGQSTAMARGMVLFRPVETVEAKLDARLGTDQVIRVAPSSSVRTYTAGATVETQATLYPSARLALAAGASRQYIVGGGTTDYLSATASTFTTLLRGVDLRLDAALQRILQVQGDVSAQESIPLFRILTHETYGAELSYRPSSQLTLVARFGYSAAGSGEGFVQSYRANWIPFPGGAVQLFFDYSEEIDPLTGQSFRRASAAPRWDVNRHAALQLSYNMSRGTGALPVEQQHLYLTFTLKL